MMDTHDWSALRRESDFEYGASTYSPGAYNMCNTPSSGRYLYHPQKQENSPQQHGGSSSSFSPHSGAASCFIPVSIHDPFSPSDEPYGRANNEYQWYSEPSRSSSRFQRTSDFDPFYSIIFDDERGGPEESTLCPPLKQEPLKLKRPKTMGASYTMPRLIELEHHVLQEQGAQRLSLEERRMHQQRDSQDPAGLLERTQKELQETGQQLLQLHQKQRRLRETLKQQRLQKQERHEQAQRQQQWLQKHERHEQAQRRLQQQHQQVQQQLRTQEQQLRTQEQLEEEQDLDEEDPEPEQDPECGDEERERDDEQGTSENRKTKRRGRVKHRKKFLEANDRNGIMRGRAPGSGRRFLCAFIIGIPDCPSFQVSRKIIGPGGANTKFIAKLCPGTKIRLRGNGSGFREPHSNAESNIPLQVGVSSPSIEEYESAKRELSSLLNAIYAEYREATGKVCRIKIDEHPKNPKMETQYATI